MEDEASPVGTFSRCRRGVCCVDRWPDGALAGDKIGEEPHARETLDLVDIPPPGIHRRALAYFAKLPLRSASTGEAGQDWVPRGGMDTTSRCLRVQIRALTPNAEGWLKYYNYSCDCAFSLSGGTPACMSLSAFSPQEYCICPARAALPLPSDGNQDRL
jgi:hypothetical protein